MVYVFGDEKYTDIAASPQLRIIIACAVIRQDRWNSLEPDVRLLRSPHTIPVFDWRSNICWEA
jgi:hypothetical protein